MIKTSARGLYGRTLYCNNYVNEEVINSVKAAVEQYNEPIYVSFDVTGRTCHCMLGNQLAKDLGNGYEVTIEYNYYVQVKKKEV